MTIEIKVPAHSDKKTYEEATNLYEQKKVANIFKTDFGYEQITEGKKLVHIAGDVAGHHAKVYKHTGEDDDGDPYHVRLFHGKAENKDAEYFTNDLDDAKSTAQHMADRASGKLRVEGYSEAHETVDLDEATAAAKTIKGKKQADDSCGCSTQKGYSVPTGLTGPLASMFGVHTQAAPAVQVKHDNDKTKPETQEHGKVATPDDLAVKLHSSLPGMTRKAISLSHIVSALKAGIQATDIQRMAHSAVGRKHIRNAGGSPYRFSEQVAEMMNAWTIELVREGSSHKYIVRDEEDIIAEGVNLTADAAMKSAARSIEELGASLEEQVIALSEEKEHAAARPSRIMEAVRSLITK